MAQKNDFVRHFRQLQPKFSRLYSQLLTDFDLTLPQYALLSQVTESGTLSMTEASTRLHITKPAITNLVDRLEKCKCLKRLPHPKDRRSYLLKIEARGEKIVREIQSSVLGILLRTLEKFGPEEKRAVARFYISLSETMDRALRHKK